MQNETATTPTVFRVIRDRDGMQVGVVQTAGGGLGWQFIPVFQGRESRKRWPTPEAAIAGRVTGCTLVAKVTA